MFAALVILITTPAARLFASLPIAFVVAARASHDGQTRMF
jgi:hypothetical protein